MAPVAAVDVKAEHTESKVKPFVQEARKVDEERMIKDGYLIDGAVCKAETEKAILVEAEIFDEPTWIPQSQIQEESEVWKKGDEGLLVVSEWWAKKQGWIE